MFFQDRIDAAKKLASALEHYKAAPDTVILAIPRGSLEMGYQLSQDLNLPLDIVVTKKIPAPENEEYAIGAVAPDGEVMMSQEIISAYNVPSSYIEEAKKKLLEKMHERYERYRREISQQDESKIPSFKGKTVIIVDDGIATGFTMKAAIHYLKREKVKKVVVAVPVSAPDSAQEIKSMVDELICLDTPAFFGAVGQFYENFPQVSDEEAANFLKKAAEEREKSEKE